MPTTPTPTRPETAEYVAAVHQLTQDFTEAWSSIISEPTDGSQEIRRLVSEFQTRFQVTLEVIVGDSVTPLPGSIHLHFACPSSQSRVSLEKFLKLPPVSITSLLGDGNTAPECRICLKPFSEQRAQAPSTNNNGENQPRSTELPAEIATASGIPIRLPCGHIFGTECIYSWITRYGGKNPPVCPLCRARLDCVENPPTKPYVEVIKVLCPEMLDSERVMDGLRELLMTFIDPREEWEG